MWWNLAKLIKFRLSSLAAHGVLEFEERTQELIQREIICKKSTIFRRNPASFVLCRTERCATSSSSFMFTSQVFKKSPYSSNRWSSIWLSNFPLSAGTNRVAEIELLYLLSPVEYLCWMAAPLQWKTLMILFIVQIFWAPCSKVIISVIISREEELTP